MDLQNYKFELVKTINEGEEVPDFSDDSDEEEEFQPTKQKEKKKKDFNLDFDFVGSTSEYNRDVWNDLAKYVKRKPTTKVDDKIEKMRKQLRKERKEAKLNSTVKIDGDAEENDDDGSNADEVSSSGVSSDDGDSDDENKNSKANENEEGSSSDGELSVSDDELVKDKIRVKERHLGKKTRKKIRLEQEREKIEYEDLASYNENVSFYEMNLSRPLLKAINSVNYKNPTPIQAATIPVALLGRDICGCAATGTGKTAAYMLPTLERLMFKPSQLHSATRVLVLVPTRELGVQVYQVTRQLSQFINVETALSVGGLDLKVQEAALRKGPDIVIATPGRLIDHLKNTPSFSLHAVEILILDEADRMLDEYFQEQMIEIIKQCNRTRQTLLFSATMTEAVDSLAAVSLKKPVRIFVDNNKDVACNLRQEFIKVRKDGEGDREALLAALVCRTFHDHCMVFVQTKRQAHRLHILLGLLSVKVGELHGDLTQAQRLDALARFRKEEIDVLLATDVAARGLDIPGVKTVINFVMPPSLEHYIHRVGRTARAGKGGVSVSLAGESERNIIKQIIKNSKIPVKARLIPPEILSKYRKKVDILESKVKEILDEEYQDRALLKMEAQANKAEKALKDSMDKKKKKSKGNKGKKKKKQDDDDDDAMKDGKRGWFQTHKERRAEKVRLRLSAPKKAEKRKKMDSDDEDDINQAKRNKKPGRSDSKKKPADQKKFVDPAEERVAREMEKVALLQARLAKRKSKPKKIKTVHDFEYTSHSKMKQGKTKKKSSFATELTDVSKKGVKSMRHQERDHGKGPKKGGNKSFTVKKGSKPNPKQGKRRK